MPSVSRSIPKRHLVRSYVKGIGISMVRFSKFLTKSGRKTSGIFSETTGKLRDSSRVGLSSILFIVLPKIVGMDAALFEFK